MKKFSLLSLLLTLLFFLYENFLSRNIPIQNPPQSKYLSLDHNNISFYLYDADTISIQHTRYRLYGIDAPELQQEYGQKAKQHVKKYLKNITKLQIYGKDRYGRTLAIFFLSDGTTLQEKLLEKGLAIIYEPYCRKKICAIWRIIQKKAKQNSYGIWSSHNFILPSDYRKKHNNYDNNIGKRK